MPIDGIDDVDFNSIWLIPDMNFTCSGTIVRVTVAGIRRNGKPRPVRLQIWRPENTTEDGITYHRVKKIALSSSIGFCSCENLHILSRCACTLNKSMQIPVEPGDIVGVELPHRHNANFELYTITESQLTSYIFKYDRSSTIFDLCKRTKETTSQPLIRIKINSSDPGIASYKCTTAINYNNIMLYTFMN